MDGGGRSYHHRGGGRRGRGYGRGRGRGRGFRHQPYNNNNRSRFNNNRGGGRPGNRFGGSQGAQDPQSAMVRQVSSFVSRVGEYKNIREATFEDIQQLRPVVATTAANINDLAVVLCSEDKLDMLFKFEQEQHLSQSKIEDGSNGSGAFNPSNVKLEDKAGKMGHLLISCAAGLPLQTPCYAALTVALHEHIQGTKWQGFAHRCVNYALQHMARDLDGILRTGRNVAHGTCRIKLLLRYLAILGKVGVVQGYQNEQAADPSKLSVFGFLSMLVEAAKAALQQNAPNLAFLLAYLVLSTLPYVIEYVPQESIDAWIIQPLETVLETYTSTFTPGTGRTSILLKSEQDDGEEDYDEEDDDEEEEEVDEEGGQICDTLQDLLRVSRKLREPSRFALPTDSPWKGLTKRSAPDTETGETIMTPITFTNEPIYLSMSIFRSVSYLVGGQGTFSIVPFGLEGVIFGRLPIFGSPPDPDDDEEEEDMEDGATKNENLQAFRSGFSLLDRFFASDILRDCLISHETFVTPTGLQQGSAKSVAEELLTASHIFAGENPSRGMEYAIVETLFALLAQSWNQSAMKHIYVSRILLELTRLQPQLFSPALAVAVTNLFGDYLPALVPASRDNFSCWFAFHLINTDYQWPSAYWELWQPYAVTAKQTSRGDFVRRSLQMMVENVSDPSVIISDCLSDSRSLVCEFFPRTTATCTEYPEGSALSNLENEINRRLWDINEDPASLLQFILSEDVAASIAGVEGTWLRSQVLTKVLIEPAKKIFVGMKDSLETVHNDDDQMVDDTHQSKDFCTMICDAIAQYSSTLTSVLAKESQQYGDIALGGAQSLRQIEAVVYFNSSILQGIIACLLKHSIINNVAVSRWVLGDLGENISGYIISRWWVYVLDALRVEQGGEGMVIDGHAAEASALASRTEMLKYTVARVCTLLATTNEKRLDPMQVDLVDGMKTIVSRALSMGILEANTANGLADLCTGFGGSVSVELLKASLAQY